MVEDAGRVRRSVSSSDVMIGLSLAPRSAGFDSAVSGAFGA